MNKTTTILILGIIAVLALSGCSIEEAIQDMTQKKITVNHTVYDGPTEISLRNDVFGEEVLIDSGTIEEPVEMDLFNLLDNLLIYRMDLQPINLVLNGSIKNPSDSSVRVTLDIATPDKSDHVRLGTVTISAGAKLELANNEGLDLPAEEIEARLYDFFNSNPEIEKALILVTVEGLENTGIKINWMELNITPCFRTGQAIDSSLMGGYADNVKSIGSVEMTGLIENYGNTELRVILVLGKYDQDPDFENGLVVDGFVAPGETVNVSQLLVEDGLARIKAAMYNAIDGTDMEFGMYLMSTEQIMADFDKVRIESKITVGI